MEPVCDAIENKLSCGPCVEETSEPCVSEGRASEVEDTVENVFFLQPLAVGAQSLDLASSDECDQHVMECEPVPAALQPFSDEEPLSEINGAESPPDLLGKMDLYPSSVLELDMYRRIYRQASWF